MNKQGVTSLGMAADMLKVAIDELQTTVDHQFTIEHYHRWKDGSVKLSRLRSIRKELLTELGRLSHQDELDAENRPAGPRGQR